MSRKPIGPDVQKRLWIESMGRCMNPDCQKNLFSEAGDILEKAHIDPYYKNEDNSFDNLVILCPNCHKKFDKLNELTVEQIQIWKQQRHDEIERTFTKKFSSFDEMSKVVQPILNRNRTIFASYFPDNKEMWERFEPEMLVNNARAKHIFEVNRRLFQGNPQYPDSSNLQIIDEFIQHVDEFEMSRDLDEKHRGVLFPEKIDSIFGVELVHENVLPMTESLEKLIRIRVSEGFKVEAMLGFEQPYVEFVRNATSETLFLDDTPRVRQLYYDNHCFIKTGMRLESLNFAYKMLRSRRIPFAFRSESMLREVDVKGIRVLFVYQYCLSKQYLMEIDPEEGEVVVNLHNWNGEGCISVEARDLAARFGVKLLTQEAFRSWLSSIQ
ncbi:HNH endonuclease signature motif containing protein [Lacticaseibacillus paracasei]|nr:HNH endonuclease signature motif containing protein [Lacticaseibacillus paracasei]